MNPSLLLGIVIGAAFVFLVLLAVVSLSGRKTSKASTYLNSRNAALLAERNNIGHEQIAATWKIAGYLAPRDTREADRKARRERIATTALAHVPALIDAMEENPSYYNICHHAVMIADELIAQLDKPKPTTTETP